MKKVLVYSLCICHLLSIISCSSSKEPVGIWVNKEKMQGKSPYKSIFITVLTADVVIRKQVEDDLAKEASSKGFKVVKSMDVIPVDLNNPKLATKEEILEKVKENGCDAIFTSVLLKKDEAVKYNPGSTSYSPTNYYTFTGTFFGYYSNWQPTVIRPTYYERDQQYFIESNVYDTESQTLMLSVQSKVFNPSSLSNFSMVYSKGLIMKMENNGLLKNTAGAKK